MAKRQLKAQLYRVTVEGTPLVTRVESLGVALRDAERLAHAMKESVRVSTMAHSW